MSSFEVASAYVRLRPDMRGFKAEAEAGAKEGFAGIAKIIGGAFAAAGAFEIGKKLVDAAAEHQAAFAGLEKSVQNAGGSVTLFGASIESVLEKEARLKGFSDEELASAMLRLVSATGNTETAFKDLGAAEDLARARHIDVASAALALSKAEQGNFTSLQRYGIIVQATTGQVAALKAEHDRYIAIGATFTAGEKQKYAAALAVAAAYDKQAKAQSAISLVEQRFGGSANTYAKTYSGQIARLEQDFHQLEVAAGSTILPTFADAAEGLGNYIIALTESGKVQQAFLAGEKTVGDGLSELKAVAETVGPPLLTIASAGAKVVETLGAGPILAAVAAYKGLGLAITEVKTAQKFYLATAAAGARPAAATTRGSLGGVTAAETGAVAANTSAQRANAVATGEAGAAERVATASRVAAIETISTLTAVTAAGVVSRDAAAAAAFEEAAGIKAVAVSASGLLLPLEAATAENVAFAAAAQAAAAAEIEMGAAGGAAAAGGLANFGRGLVGLINPTTVAIAGVAALAGGIVYLATRDDDVTAASHRFRDSLSDTTKAINDQKTAAAELAAAQAAVANNPTAGNQADLVGQQQKNKIAVAEANEKLAEQVKQLSAVSLAETRSTLPPPQIAVGRAGPIAGPRNDEIMRERFALSTGKNVAAAKAFVAQLAAIAKGQDDISPLMEHNIALTEAFALAVKRAPTSHEIDLFVNNQDPKAGFLEVISGVAALASALKRIGAASVTIAAPKPIDTRKQAIGEAQAQAAAAGEVNNKAITNLQKNLADVTSAGDAALATQRADLEQQVRQGKDQVTQAIASSQQSLTSIGQTIGQMVGQVIDKPLQDAQVAITRSQDKIAATFVRLNAPLNAEAQAISIAQERIALSFDRAAAPFKAEADAITVAQAQIAASFDRAAAPFKAQADAISVSQAVIAETWNRAAAPFKAEADAIAVRQAEIAVTFSSANAALQRQTLTISAQQAQIAATFDAAYAPYQAQAQLITTQQDIIAAKYDRLSAALVPASNKLAAENAAAQLASDKLALQNLRAEVVLPGGKGLSSDGDKAIAQLKRLAAGAGSLTKPAIDQFVLTYSAALRAVEGDQLNLKKSSIDAARGAAELPLQLHSDQIKIATDLLDRAKALKEAPITIKNDQIAVQAALLALREGIKSGPLDLESKIETLRNDLIAQARDKSEAPLQAKSDVLAVVNTLLDQARNKATAPLLAKSDWLGIVNALLDQSRNKQTLPLTLKNELLSLRKALLGQTQEAATVPLTIKSADLKLAQDNADIAKDAIAKRVNDITNAFEQGRIKFSKLSDEFAGLLTSHHVSFTKAGTLLGSAFEDAFRAQFSGLELQAIENLKAPKRPGLGLLPTIVKPEQVITDTLLANQKSQGQLAKTQASLTRKTNGLLEKIHNAQAGAAFASSLDKNPGTQSKTTNLFSGSGG